jgi:hypothetical protein
MAHAMQAIFKGDLNSKDDDHNFHNFPLFKLSVGKNNRLSQQDVGLRRLVTRTWHKADLLFLS